MKNDNKDGKIKIVIAGSQETGKTILFNYLKDGSLQLGNYYPTIGLEYEGKKVLLYKNNIYNIALWDSAGQPRFSITSKSFMKGTHIFFIFFNYNDRRSFDYAKTLFNERENEQQVFVLIGAKYDLTINTDKKDNIVHEEEVLELATEKNVLCAHISLLEKYSNGVIELVKKSLDEYIKKRQMQ